MKTCHLATSSTFSFLDSIYNVICEQYDLTLLSARQLIVESFTNQHQSNLDLKIQNYVQGGEIIPDEFIMERIKNKLTNINDGVLISDFPKTQQQLEKLTNMLQKNNFEIKKIWVFELSNFDVLLNDKSTSLSKIEKNKRIQKALFQNRIVESMANNQSLITKITFDYPLDEYYSTIINKIKAVHNKV